MYLVFTNQNNIDKENTNQTNIVQNSDNTKLPFTLERQKLNKNENSNLPEPDSVDKPLSLDSKFVYRRKYTNGNPINTINIGSDSYVLTGSEDLDLSLDGIYGSDNTKLSKNNAVIWSKNLFFTTFDPVISFFSSNSDIVLAYSHYPDLYNNSENPTYEADVIINANSANKDYNYDISFGAYPLASSYSYFGKKGESYYFNYDHLSYELPDMITEIIDPPCCEPAMYAISADSDSLLFYTKDSDGYWYANKLTIKR